MEKKFSETLVFLADLTGKNLNEQMHDFYLHHLKPIGLERVIPVLLNYATKSKWPSIQDIFKDLGISTENIEIEEEAELFKAKINKLVRNPGGSTSYHCEEAKRLMKEDEWKAVNEFMTWSVLSNGDIINEERLAYELVNLKKHYISHKKKQSFEKHQELLALDSNDLVQGLLSGSAIQKQIDNIPF